jgi:hypothetical protein
MRAQLAGVRRQPVARAPRCLALALQHQLRHHSTRARQRRCATHGRPNMRAAPPPPSPADEQAQECAVDLLTKVAAAAGASAPDWCSEHALPRLLRLALHRDYSIRVVRCWRGAAGAEASGGRVAPASLSRAVQHLCTGRPKGRRPLAALPPSLAHTTPPAGPCSTRWRGWCSWRAACLRRSAAAGCWTPLQSCVATLCGRCAPTARHSWRRWRRACRAPPCATACCPCGPRWRATCRPGCSLRRGARRGRCWPSCTPMTAPRVGGCVWGGRARKLLRLCLQCLGCTRESSRTECCCRRSIQRSAPPPSPRPTTRPAGRVRVGGSRPPRPQRGLRPPPAGSAAQPGGGVLAAAQVRGCLALLDTSCSPPPTHTHTHTPVPPCSSLFHPSSRPPPSPVPFPAGLPCLCLPPARSQGRA